MNDIWTWVDDRETSKHHLTKIWNDDETEMTWIMEVHTDHRPFHDSIQMGAIKIRGTLGGGELTIALQLDE